MNQWNLITFMEFYPWFWNFRMKCRFRFSIGKFFSFCANYSNDFWLTFIIFCFGLFPSLMWCDTYSVQSGSHPSNLLYGKCYICVLPVFWVKIPSMWLSLVIVFPNALLFCSQSWLSFLGRCIYKIRSIYCLALNPNGFKVHKDFTKLIAGWVVGQTMSPLLVKMKLLSSWKLLCSSEWLGQVFIWVQLLGRDGNINFKAFCIATKLILWLFGRFALIVTKQYAELKDDDICSHNERFVFLTCYGEL